MSKNITIFDQIMHRESKLAECALNKGIYNNRKQKYNNIWFSSYIVFLVLMFLNLNFECWYISAHRAITICLAFQRNKSHTAYFEIWTIYHGIGVKNTVTFEVLVILLTLICLLPPPWLICKSFPTKNHIFGSLSNPMLEEKRNLKTHF